VLRRSLAVLVVLATIACGSEKATDPPVEVCTVSAVAINPSTATVPISQTATLAANVTQQHCGTLTTTWSSSNQNVATVSASGVVTAVAEGTSTITAAVNNVQGTALVTVPPCVTAITVSPTVLTIAVPLTSHIAATLTPSNCASANITWSSSATAIATVSNGNVTAVSPGTATITASIGALQATTTVTVQAPQLGSVWEESVMRVEGDGDSPTGYVSAAWAAGVSDVFVAAYPNFYRWNGSTWTILPGNPAGVTAMWGSSPNSVFGVGQAIRRWDGTAWTDMTSPTTQRLRAIWGSSATSVYAVGQGGTIIHYNGTSWSVMTSPTTANLVGISGVSESLIFAAGEDGSIVRFDGMNWTTVSSPATSFLTGIWMANASLGYAIGGDGLLKFNGTTWTVDGSFGGSGTPRAIWGSAPDNIVVAGDGGQMRRFDGTSWSALSQHTATSLTTLTGSGFRSFAFGEGVEILQAGTGASLLYSAPSLTSVWAVDANTAFAAASDGVIWRYANGFWQDDWTGSFAAFTDIWAASDHEALAVGRDPLTAAAVSYRYDGTSWHKVDMPNSASAVSLWGTSIANVIAGSRFGPLQRYDGTAWSSASSANATDLVALWGTSATDMLLVGGSGYAARFNGAGAITPLSTGITDALVSVWGSSPTNYFIGTNNSRFYRFDGTSFSQTTLPSGVGAIYGLWGTGASQVFAVDYTGSVIRFDGTQWVKLRESSGDANYVALHGTASRLFAVGPRGSLMMTR